MIEIENLRKQYSDVSALDGINLRIPDGRVALLGPNGAGKSTLLKILLGLIPPTSGNGKVLGYDVTDQGIEIRKRIGYMPEHHCLPSEKNAVEFVSAMGRLSGMSKSKAMERTHEVLHYLNMRDERYRKIASYSGGMKQKVKLAQAIVHDPDIVFMDEPTSGLDPLARNEMLNALRSMSEQGHMNFILSTHILHDVEQICSHVIMLNRGKVVLEDSLKNLFSRSSASLTLKTIMKPKKLANILNSEGYKTEVFGEEVVVTKKDRNDVNDIISIMAKENIPLRQISNRVKNLDQIYLEIVREKKNQAGWQNNKNYGNDSKLSMREKGESSNREGGIA